MTTTAAANPEKVRSEYNRRYWEAHREQINERRRAASREQIAESPRMPTSEQVAHAAGITYRQLDHWTRRGHLRPVTKRSGKFSSGPGGLTREWPPAEVAVACRMARLVAAGLTLEAAAELARAPGRHVLAPGITIEVSP